MKVGILIQARSTSTRLPRKIFAPIPEKSETLLIDHVWNRLQGTGFDVLSFVIPDTDSELIDYCKRRRYEFFTGSLDDVRDRYRKAASHYSLEYVVRATGDNPCVDTRVCAETIREIKTRQWDHFAFDDLPLGCAVEAFSSEALNTDVGDDNPDYLEHVSVHIKKHPELFKIHYKQMTTHPSQKKPRLTVDTPQDLEVVRQVFRKLARYDFTWEDALDLYEKEPQIFQLNEGIEQRKV